MPRADGPGHGRTFFVQVSGPLGPDDALRLCRRVQVMLAADRTAGVVCQLRGTADLGVVDTLARLSLLTRRLAVCLRLAGSAAGLEELLALTGLTGAISAGPETVGSESGGSAV